MNRHEMRIHDGLRMERDCLDRELRDTREERSRLVVDGETLRSEMLRLIETVTALSAENARIISALRALVECFRAEAKGEAEHEYAHLTLRWQNIRTVEGRMKEQCADRLAVLCDAAEGKL